MVSSPELLERILLDKHYINIVNALNQLEMEVGLLATCDYSV